MREEYIFPKVIADTRSKYKQYVIDYNHRNEICLAKFGYHNLRELSLSPASCKPTNKNSGSDTGNIHS